ncbi:MAG: AMP-binding protein [Alphaproteobacteria bacterium]
MNANLYDQLASTPADPAKVFVSEADGQALTFGGLEQRTAQLANALVGARSTGGLGARPGERVAMQVAKSPQALALYLAAMRAGLVLVPLNTGYRAGELEYFFGDAEPVIIVCDPAAKTEIASLSNAAGAQIVTLDEDGAGSLSDLASASDATFQTITSAADDLACILYTSGTTGRSKGAMITHGNLVSNARALVETWGITADDVLIHALPIFHVHGLFVAVNTMLAAGATMLWHARFDADAVIADMARATMLMGVPTFYTRLLGCDALSRDTVTAMRLFIAGSAPLLPRTFADFEARTGRRILERYGMTETGMSTSNPLHGKRRPGCIGLPLPGVAARIATEDGTPVAVGETGVLEVRGPNVFAGYWRMPDKTESEFRDDGFFITGDLAAMDGDGYISINGRAGDMIISGGFNVYPREIEQVIDDLPGVAESAVFGVAHQDLGEGVVAAIVSAQGSAALQEMALIARIRDRLAGFKTPKRIFTIAQLPRNVMGKVQKSELRDIYSQTFSQSLSGNGSR